MFHHKKTEPKISLIFPAFYDSDILFKQMENLNQQTCKEFEILIADLYYENRLNKFKDFVSHLDYNVVYVPHYNDTIIVKRFDFDVLNNLILLANTNNIANGQEWRFFHPRFIEIACQYLNIDFINIEWQIFNNNNISQYYVDNNHILTKDLNDELLALNYCKFPDIEPIITEKNNFENWGHFIFSKNLWFEINGVDELANNLWRSIDTDLCLRLTNLWNRENREFNFINIKNVCGRVYHECKFEWLKFYNQNDRNCVICKLFQEKLPPEKPDVIPLIEDGHFEEIPSQAGTIGFRCKYCNLCGETNRWWLIAPTERIYATQSISASGFKVGRNLKLLNENLQNKTLEEKVNILKNSWHS